MKWIWAFFTIVLISLNVAAKTVVPKNPYLFLSRWVSSKPTTLEVGGEKKTMQYSQRFIQMGPDQIPVATMSLGEYVVKDPNRLPSDFAKEMGKFFGIKKWKQENRGSYTAYEAEMPEYSRFVKLFVSKKGNTFKYSLVSIRAPYLMPTYFEAEIIQRDQMGEGRSVASFEGPNGMFAQMLHLLVNPANAAVPTNYQDILGIINDLWAPLTNASGNLVKQVGSAQGTAVRISGDITKNVGVLSSTIDNNAVRVVNMASQFDGTVNRGIDTVQKTLSSGNVAKLGSIAGVTFGAGAALGGMAVNAFSHLITDGVVPLAIKAYYEIVGELSPEVRKRIAEKAPKAWDDLQRFSFEAANIENKMAQQLGAMQWLAQFNPTMSYEELNNQEKLLQKEYRKAIASLDASDRNSEKNCAAQVSDIEEKITYIQNLKVIIGRGGATKPQDICKTFDQMYSQWANVEVQLNNARNIFLRNAFIIVKDLQNEAAEAVADTKQRKKDNTCEDESPLLKQANKDVADNKCDCTARIQNEDCANICETQRSYKRQDENCIQMARGIAKINRFEEQRITAQGLEQNSLMLKNAYDNFLGAYCDSTKQDCKGNTDGSFKAVSDRMQTMFDKIFKLCGNNSIVRMKKDPAAAAAGEAKGEAAANSDLPLASMDARALPKPAESSNFVVRWAKSALSAITNIFK
jgi:hypothetical protein